MSSKKLKALEWQAARSAEQVNGEREAIMSRLEKLGENMWKQGKCDDWLLPLEEEVCEWQVTA